jgi:5-methylcytosine-specific restriction endonuclease McrA
MLACAVPRCPLPAVHRGRCIKHRQTTTERGYGPEWQRIAKLTRERTCEVCGTEDDLTVDHVLPKSMGGTDDPFNLRTLCRSHHASVGVAIGRN